MDRSVESRRTVQAHLCPPSLKVHAGLPFYALSGIGVDDRLEPFDLSSLRAPQAFAARISGLTAASRTRRNLLRAYRPDLLNKRDLGVLYVGAGFYELADEARWTHIECTVTESPVPRVYGVGAELSPSALQRTPYLPYSNIPSPLKRVFFGTAASHAEEIQALIDSGAIDVVIFHHPDLWGDERLLADDAMLRRLLRSGLPFFGSSFSPQDYEFAAAGFASLGSPLEGALFNPAFHHKSYETANDPDVRWGHVLWRVDTTRRAGIVERTQSAAQWQAMCSAIEALASCCSSPIDAADLARRSPCGRYLGATVSSWIDLDNAEFCAVDGRRAPVSREDLAPLCAPMPMPTRALAVLELMRTLDPLLDERIESFLQTARTRHSLPRSARACVTAPTLGFFNQD